MLCKTIMFILMVDLGLIKQCRPFFVEIFKFSHLLFSEQAVDERLFRHFLYDFLCVFFVYESIRIVRLR